MDAIDDDVAEFALLLTRLKKRTDRSYAALARRLGMNASTLHRYCIGEAVPLDFAGIEQFAALCGASPEERVELHRRWILAAAARQRPRPPAARRAPTTPDGTTNTPAAAASPSVGTPADEAPEPMRPSTRRPEPASPGRPRAPPRRPPPPGARRGQGPAGAGPRRPRGPPGSPPRAAPTTAARPGEGTGGLGRRRPRRPHRIRCRPPFRRP